jgi:hypothetical protein
MEDREGKETDRCPLTYRYETYLTICLHLPPHALQNCAMSLPNISAQTLSTSMTSFSGGTNGSQCTCVCLAWPSITFPFLVSGYKTYYAFPCWQLPQPLQLTLSMFSVRVELSCLTFGTAYLHSQHMPSYVSITRVYLDIWRTRTLQLLQFYQRLRGMRRSSKKGGMP